MNPLDQYLTSLTRRQFFGQATAGVGLGSIALAALLEGDVRAAGGAVANPLAPRQPHFAPRAKNVIYLHMAGSPPQHETFDYKPQLAKLDGKDAHAKFFEGKTFAFIKGTPKMLGPRYPFKQYGESGAWVSDQLPHIATCVDDMLFVKSMSTDQFNHAPAQLRFHTGEPRLGHPSMGAWITYGLGSVNQNLPGFVVLLSGGKVISAGKSGWGSAFLPSVYQGVQCRSAGDPVLYLSNPAGMDGHGRRRTLNALRDLNQIQYEKIGDPETISRIEQFELAYRMQTAAPEVMDITREPNSVLEAYGAEPGKSSFANNCLLARRLVENGVRYVQLFDWGWDVHGTGRGDDLITQFPKKCRETDRPIAALLKDLKAGGLLDETLVIWSGEFGRTPMNEARGGSKFFGRDHHPDCFTIWMAGGGVRAATTYGQTDELGYSVAENKVTPHDLQATILTLLGLNPFKLTYPHNGLPARLIGPTSEAVVPKELLA